VPTVLAGAKSKLIASRRDPSEVNTRFRSHNVILQTSGDLGIQNRLLLGIVDAHRIQPFVSAHRKLECDVEALRWNPERRQRFGDPAGAAFKGIWPQIECNARDGHLEWEPLRPKRVEQKICRGAGCD